MKLENLKKVNGNRLSIRVHGFHKDIKNHCEDAAAFGSVVEYVNNIDETQQSNNMNQHDRLLITEDDYDKYIFPLYITKTLSHMQPILIYYILLVKIVMYILYILRTSRS